MYRIKVAWLKAHPPMERIRRNLRPLRSTSIDAKTIPSSCAMPNSKFATLTGTCVEESSIIFVPYVKNVYDAVNWFSNGKIIAWIIAFLAFGSTEIQKRIYYNSLRKIKNDMNADNLQRSFKLNFGASFTVFESVFSCSTSARYDADLSQL